MTRPYPAKQFDSVYDTFICKGTFNEEPDYYPRYRSRYEALLERYCELAPETPLRVLDIGGGQLGLLCKQFWNDEICVADIGGEHLQYLQSQGVETVQWNLCRDESPFDAEFDVIFFSEVIEHLPLPVHLVLEKLKRSLKPGGTLICSTPNLYRLRNIVYMALGKRIYDYFRIPENQGLGHVIEYSVDHLQWQFEQAGLKNCQIEFCQMHHSPNDPIFRVLYWLGSPLFLVPRFRDNLVAIAQSPA
ncbi:MAG: class I SAM-dependent methyltransferase [Oculatellaceae cyanobacterium Prado106]|jgi:SAM-dependent methyltransferase|nr:class I SAM-dependent methyltransferase [Oculatellaceae cyanobacterium Prado106]